MLVVEDRRGLFQTYPLAGLEGVLLGVACTWIDVMIIAVGGCSDVAGPHITPVLATDRADCEHVGLLCCLRSVFVGRVRNHAFVLYSAILMA